jgi:hypothetical protein
MFVAYCIVGVLLAVALLGSASAQLARNKVIVANMTNLGVPLTSIPWLASCLIAGSAGLVIGLWYAPLGIAAAIGVVLYFIGANIAHLRKGDIKGTPAPLVFLVLAVVALALRVVAP